MRQNQKALEIALNKAPELSSMWAKGNLAEKRKIQKMVFPDGIEYDHKITCTSERVFSANAINGLQAFIN